MRGSAAQSAASTGKVKCATQGGSARRTGMQVMLATGKFDNVVENR